MQPGNIYVYVCLCARMSKSKKRVANKGSLSGHSSRQTSPMAKRAIKRLILRRKENNLPPNRTLELPAGHTTREDGEEPQAHQHECSETSFRYEEPPVGEDNATCHIV
jgi:hypothetical protein